MEKEDKDILKKYAAARDWEAFHELYDTILELKLRKLAPNFMAEMDELSATATFWFS